VQVELGVEVLGVVGAVEQVGETSPEIAHAMAPLCGSQDEGDGAGDAFRSAPFPGVV